jgi:hypothetical protein
MLQMTTLERIDSLVTPDRPKGMRMLARIWMPLAIVAAIAVGVFFRLADLNSVPGLNGDEAWSGVQAVRFLQGESIAWRTPTGNPINFFFLGPLVVLHTMFAPSAVLLRSVSAISGLLALAANYWLCRRTFDRTTAILSTVLLAALPVMIAYSRFAWDSSQTPLFSALVVFAALGSKRQSPRLYYSSLGIFAAMLAAIWVHPTNVFLLPLVAVCLCRESYWEKLSAKVIYLFVGVVAAGALVMRSPADLMRFVIDFGRLLNGTTVYRFISGGVQGNAIDVSDLLTWTILFAAIYGFVQRIKSERNWADGRLAIGLLLSVVGFFIVAGPDGVEPHFERYALWMIVPTVLVLSRGAGWWLCEARSTRPTAIAMTATVIGLLLASCDRYYFHVFATSGGDSHLAFATGDVDPKERALNEILSSSEPSTPITIISGNWWTRLPIEYLSAKEPRVRVQQSFDGPISDLPKNAFFVELVGSRDEQLVHERLSSNHVAYEKMIETDRKGRPIVVVFRLLNPSPTEREQSGA